MKLDLKNKIVIVTGANGGIGMEISKHFLTEGSILFPFYRNDPEKIKPLFEWAKDNSIDTNNIIPIESELTDSIKIKSCLNKIIEKKGKIDILVNNAGHSEEIPFLLFDDSAFHENMNVNFIAPALITQKVLRYMIKEKRGSIINVSSVVGTNFGRGVSLYSSAKAATNRLTQILAMEMGRKGIRVNAVAPGIIQTKMSIPIINRMKIYGSDMIPLKRHGTPSDVARAVLFLASDVSSYITGHVLTVDGGISL